MKIKLIPWMRIVLGLLALSQFVVRGTSSLRTKSPVWDEQMHIDYGVNFLEKGPTFDPADHPYPVTALLVTPIVWFSDPVRVGKDDAGPLIIEEPSNLYPARQMNLLIGAMGLLLFAVFVGYATDGLVGLLVLVLGALDPGWLAHARFVTTDICYGLGFALAGIALLHHRQSNIWAPVVGAGVATGLAVLSKFSGWLLIPLGLFCMLIPDATDNEPGFRARLPKALKTAGLMLAVALLVCLIVFQLPYLWGKGAFTDGVQHWWAGWDNFLEVRGDHRGTYFWGDFHSSGSFLYFPVLFLSKTPLVMLLMLAIVAGFAVLRSEVWRYRALLAIPVGYALIAILSRVNLGYRHFIPVLPFIWLVLAVALAKVIRTYQHGISAVVVLLLFLALEVVAVHPNYLPFTNELFGGEASAHEIAVDSATDWGQDLPALRQYLREHPEAGEVHLAYFGLANPRLYGINFVWRSCGALGLPRPPGARTSNCQDGAATFAISATCLQGGAGVRPGGELDVRDECYAWLRNRKPDVVLGGSILVFHKLERDTR